ncbi:MAG TPA: lysoplasmalogenase family protein [Jatrophihabitans sp.]|nr:lysoplasmalogenase family protein [Jatrophihabitans sp.]
MTATGWAWLAAAGIFALVDWIAVAQGARQTERIAKPLVLLAIIGAALAAHPIKPGVQGWLIAALSLGLIGDIALVAERRPARVPVGATGGRHQATAAATPGKAPRLAVEPAGGRTQLLFLAGLLAFLLGHLGYARAMQVYGTDRLSVAFGLTLVLIALLSFGYRIMAGAHALGGGRLTVAVVLYVVALGSAVVLGVGTEQLWIAAGIVLFAISDLVLAYDRFVQARSHAPVTVAISYHLAQALLLLGLVS